LGKAQLHLDYFSLTGDARAYRLDATGLVQQLVRRIGSTNWFLGARYLYFSSESRFDAERPIDVPQRSLDSAIGKMGLVVDYDTRDNIFTPNRGAFLEAEVRWNVTPRWALVAFGGVGKAYGRRQSWSEADTVGSGGVGLRYLVARKLNMYAGLDVARGPEDAAVYITAGSNWR